MYEVDGLLFLGEKLIVPPQWKFKLSRTPWKGGKFERMLGLVKWAFNKTVGNRLHRRGHLTTHTGFKLLQFGRPSLLPETQSNKLETQTHEGLHHTWQVLRCAIT